MKLESTLSGMVVLALAAFCLAVSAPGQETPPPEKDFGERPAEQPAQVEDDAEPEAEQRETESLPTPRQPSPEDIIRQFQEQRPQVVPILPTGPEGETARRAESGEEFAERRPALLPDGAMLVDRAGRITREGEWWTFNFESDNQSYPEPPMKLLPNQALERMVRESGGGLDPVVFVLTGEVTDFRGENFLLPRKVLRKRNLGNLKK
jgi:hypothetical protein